MLTSEDKQPLKNLSVYIVAVFVFVFVVGYIFRGEEPTGAPAAERPTKKPPSETYFAEIAEDGTVLRVIVADQEFINSGAVGDPSNWIETKMDGSQRYNYAGIGDRYDATEDAFIKRKPTDTATYDPTTKRWEVPIDENVIRVQR